MESRRLRIILLIVAAIALIGGIVALVRYAPRVPERPSEPGIARVQYMKGNASFSYPASWEQNDIPTSPGYISVQVYDPEHGIVFVASSNGEESDPHVDGVVTKDADIIVGGIAGRERAWENDKTFAVVMRADRIAFGGRTYRFEMFGHLSRKVPMQEYWRDIMSSVRFAESEIEDIVATEQATSTDSGEEQQ